MDNLYNLEGIKDTTEEVIKKAEGVKDLKDEFWERVKDEEKDVSEGHRNGATISFGSSSDVDYYKNQYERDKDFYKFHTNELADCMEKDSGLTGYHKGQMEIEKEHMEASKQKYEEALEKESQQKR